MTAAARYRAACAALGLPVWRPGMLGARAHDRMPTRFIGAHVDDADGMDLSGSQPDFTDPATIGCLLAAVREAWAAPGAYPKPFSAHFPSETTTAELGWEVFVWRDDQRKRLGVGPTEADALIAALEAAAARRGGQP